MSSFEILGLTCHLFAFDYSVPLTKIQTRQYGSGRATCPLRAVACESSCLRAREKGLLPRESLTPHVVISSKSAFDDDDPILIVGVATIEAVRDHRSKFEDIECASGREEAPAAKLRI